MKKPHVKSDIASTLHEAALQYAETSEGVACEGTAVERRTIKVRDKAFLFLGANDVMLKLSDSLAEATDLAATEPGRCKVGAHGWVTVACQAGDAKMKRLLRWIDESYRLFAPKSKKHGKS